MIDLARVYATSGALQTWRPVGDSNPCRRRERAVSWASRRTGRGKRPLSQGKN